MERSFEMKILAEQVLNLRFLYVSFHCIRNLEIARNKLSSKN